MKNNSDLMRAGAKAGKADIKQKKMNDIKSYPYE